MSEVTPTRSALLEIREERRAMREGYRFLDEKRLILAAAILQELTGYLAAKAQFDAAYAAAAAMLREALARHGLDGLVCYPPGSIADQALTLSRERVLGLSRYQASLQAPDPGEVPTHCDQSPEAERCRTLFSELIPVAADLAARAGNLERLRREYVRTARRARALEDVLLPELEHDLKHLDSELEEMEREEALRLRWLGGEEGGLGSQGSESNRSRPDTVTGISHTD